MKKKDQEIEVKVVKKVYFKTFTLTILQAGASQIFQIGPARKEEPKSNL